MSLFTPNQVNFDKLIELGLPKHLTKFSINITAKEPVEFVCSFYPTDEQGKLVFDELQKNLVQSSGKFVLQLPESKEQTKGTI